MEGCDGGGGGGGGGGGELRGGAAAAGGGEGRIRVLVVDDSPVDRKVVERSLLKAGNVFEVITVDGGKKALEFLGLNGEPNGSTDNNGQNIDIILTDYCMPEMNGYEFLKIVKEQKRQGSIPVVLMSSENDSQRISRCRATGAEDFILKPLQTVDVQRLRNYARPPVASATKRSGKRKLSLDVNSENNESERRPRPRLAGVAVA